MILALTNCSDVALVDDDQYEKIAGYKWRRQVNANGKVYVVRSRSRKEPSGPHLIKLHRVLTGVTSSTQDVDHVNNNGLDNRLANLRVCTRGENLRNTRKRDNCSSAYKGVYWHRKAGKWLAQIKPPSGNVYLGLFEDETEAAQAYDAAAMVEFGQFAKLNFGKNIALKEKGLI